MVSFFQFIMLRPNYVMIMGEYYERKFSAYLFNRCYRGFGKYNVFMVDIYGPIVEILMYFETK